MNQGVEESYESPAVSEAGPGITLREEMEFLRGRKVVVGSVATGDYSNYGNRLIEQSVFNLLQLPTDTPRFSVFESLSDGALEFINSHDYVIITGCTTLQDDPGHQRCFDRQFKRILPRKVCFGAGFYCEPGESPSLRVAGMYDTPIGVRDPWSAEFLTHNGIENYLIGCPTLIDQRGLSSWRENPDGPVLISSTPKIELQGLELRDGRKTKYIKHDPWSAGEELKDFGIFEDASLVLTGRLHAALPAIARGIRVRFYGRECWHKDYRNAEWGNVRYSLLGYLGIDLAGNDNAVYPKARINSLKASYHEWLFKVFN